MIQSDPPITSTTIRTPKASANTLLVLSGPVVMWRSAAILARPQAKLDASSNPVSIATLRLLNPACARAKT